MSIQNQVKKPQLVPHHWIRACSQSKSREDAACPPSLSQLQLCSASRDLAPIKRLSSVVSEDIFSPKRQRSPSEEISIFTASNDAEDLVFFEPRAVTPEVRTSCEQSPVNVVQFSHSVSDKPLVFSAAPAEPLVINWERVIERFDSAFDQNFSSNKKAHFDSLPEEWTSDAKVVDGARSKWRRLLAVDALLYLLQHDDFDLSFRRSFNQQRQLAHCIFMELHTQSPHVLLELLRARSVEQEESDLDAGSSTKRSSQETLAELKRRVSSCPAVVTPSSAAAQGKSFDFSITARSEYSRSVQKRLEIQNVRSEWKTMSVMLDKLAEDVPAKSRLKFENCVKALCGHELLKPFHDDLTPVLLLAVERALFVFPILASVNDLAMETQRIIHGVAAVKTESSSEKHVVATRKKKPTSSMCTSRRARPITLSSYTPRHSPRASPRPSKSAIVKNGGAAKSKRKPKKRGVYESETESEEEVEESDSDSENELVDDPSETEKSDSLARPRRQSQKKREMIRWSTAQKTSSVVESSSAMPTKDLIPSVSSSDRFEGELIPWGSGDNENDFEPLLVFLDHDESDPNDVGFERDIHKFFLDGEFKGDPHCTAIPTTISFDDFDPHRGGTSSQFTKMETMFCRQVSAFSVNSASSGPFVDELLAAVDSITCI